jgi:hypothetical protein
MDPFVRGFVMSMMALTPPYAPIHNVVAANLGNVCPDDVVEISLLLPSGWANELIELSRERQQSVAQILRSMIGHALHEGAQ